LHADRLELVLRRAQLHELAPAERSVQAAVQGQQEWAAAAIVVERDLSVSIDGGQREGGGGVTWGQRAERHGEGRLCFTSVADRAEACAESLLSFTSVEEWEHDERAGLDPGALAHRLGLLHELLTLVLVALIQERRGEPVIAGEQELRLVDLLGERERFPVVRD